MGPVTRPLKDNISQSPPLQLCLAMLNGKHVLKFFCCKARQLFSLLILIEIKICFAYVLLVCAAVYVVFVLTNKRSKICFHHALKDIGWLYSSINKAIPEERLIVKKQIGKLGQVFARSSMYVFFFFFDAVLFSWIYVMASLRRYCMDLWPKRKVLNSRCFIVAPKSSYLD